jgi:putative nucleotidyltransferase with HDIG domain
MSRGLVAYVTLIGVLAIALAVATLLHFPMQFVGFKPWHGVVALMALTVIAEGLGVRIAAGQAVFSVGLIPIVATVPLFGPSVAVASTAVSQAFARTVLQKHTNVFLVSAVIAIDTGKRVSDVWRQLAPVAFANDLASSSLSLFVVFAFWGLGVSGVFVVLLPLFFVHHAYGAQHKLAKQNREILEFTIRTIEAKDPYTSGHSVRVASLSQELAEKLGLTAARVEEVETAALLHDVGKIDFAYSELIGSPAKLTDVEREMIRSHPDRGARLLASLSNLSNNVLAAVRHHHEHYDGNGYPDGLAGNEIPLAARIIMVVDTVDAMLSNRPYRMALSVEEVASELRRFSGRQFDPNVVAKFLEAGMLERAARRAEMDRTPLPLAGAIQRGGDPVSYSKR